MDSGLESERVVLTADIPRFGLPGSTEGARILTGDGPRVVS